VQSFQSVNANKKAALRHPPEPGAFLINLALAVHRVEVDLRAARDVVNQPRSPMDHAFWSPKEMAVSPYNAAVTLPGDAMNNIAQALCLNEDSIMPSGPQVLTA
ncbi:putative dehydrogenase (partial), partial [Erwinia amylovora ATCC 49946]